mgnify:CR=1 FL=1
MCDSHKVVSRVLAPCMSVNMRTRQGMTSTNDAAHTKETGSYVHCEVLVVGSCELEVVHACFLPKFRTMPRSVNGLKYYDVQKPPSAIIFGKEDWTICVDASNKTLKFFNSKMKLKVSMEARELLSLEPAAGDSGDAQLIMLTYKPPGGPVKGKTLKYLFSSLQEVQDIGNEIVRMAPRCQVPRQIRLQSSLADDKLTRENLVWSTLLENMYGFPEEWLAHIKPEAGVLELVEEVGHSSNWSAGRKLRTQAPTHHHVYRLFLTRNRKSCASLSSYSTFGSTRWSVAQCSWSSQLLTVMASKRFPDKSRAHLFSCLCLMLSAATLYHR